MTLPLKQHGPPSSGPPRSHTLLLHISQDAFLGGGPTSLLILFSLPKHKLIPALSYLSEAADSVSHFLSSLSSLLLADFLTEKKSFARLTLTTKDMLFYLFFFYISFFNLN